MRQALNLQIRKLKNVLELFPWVTLELGMKHKFLVFMQHSFPCAWIVVQMSHIYSDILQVEKLEHLVEHLVLQKNWSTSLDLIQNPFILRPTMGLINLHLWPVRSHMSEKNADSPDKWELSTGVDTDH